MQTTLTGKGLKVRLFVPEDAELLYEAAHESIAEVFPWLPWCHPDYKIGDSRFWLAQQPELARRGESWSFAVFAEDDDDESRILGGCGISGIDNLHRFCNLGYWVRTSEVGKGIATRATQLCARFALENVGLARVEIVVHVDNKASLQVARKCGAHEEGILRNRIHIHDANYDAWMFSLIATDFEQ